MNEGRLTNPNPSGKNNTPLFPQSDYIMQKVFSHKRKVKVKSENEIITKEMEWPG